MFFQIHTGGFLLSKKEKPGLLPALLKHLKSQILLLVPDIMPVAGRKIRDSGLCSLSVRGSATHWRGQRDRLVDRGRTGDVGGDDAEVAAGAFDVAQRPADAEAVCREAVELGNGAALALFAVALGLLLGHVEDDDEPTALERGDGRADGCGGRGGVAVLALGAQAHALDQRFCGHGAMTTDALNHGGLTPTERRGARETLLDVQAVGLRLAHCVTSFVRRSFSHSIRSTPAVSKTCKKRKDSLPASLMDRNRCGQTAGPDPLLESGGF